MKPGLTAGQGAGRTRRVAVVADRVKFNDRMAGRLAPAGLEG